jgi:hypothetical protein
VWCALIETSGEEDALGGEAGEDDPLLAHAIGRPMLFDPTYLEVERIVAEQMQTSEHDDEKETLMYLIKWVNLPYSEVTWEDAEPAMGDFIFPEHVERFKRSCKFPTEKEITTGRSYEQSDIRPALEVYLPNKPPPPFLGERQLKDCQSQLLRVKLLESFGLQHAWC